MSVQVVEKLGDVKIYGNGLLGGKGDGLVKINECHFLKAQKLRTRVLTTVFYDRFLEHGGKLEDEELAPVVSILEEVGESPISVRSSATNEGWVAADGTGSVHAGENASFMLPNNHPNFSVRFNQLQKAIGCIYHDFIQKQSPGSQEKMAIVINPIPGIYDDTLAGPVYYPLVSGVANSFFPYALKTQNPNHGFARIALGHGYAVVLDDFPVISMATIKNPIPLKLLGAGQKYFYAIDLTKNDELHGNELETMKKLHVKFSNPSYTRFLGTNKDNITFDACIEKDCFGFQSGLIEIMETIAAKISTHFQIEFVFNIDLSQKNKERGVFHVVQLTQLPELKCEAITIPRNANHTYLSITNLQGHGIKPGIKYAVVVSPFIYAREMHDTVRTRISAINLNMRERGENYILIAPGRLGSKNRDWGIQVDYREVDRAVALFEYGVDIAGRPEPLPEQDNLTGGIYGSHFLYMLQGGHDEEQKKMQTRMFGTQGTHFLTNLMGNNVIYGYIAPSQDRIDPWFFTLSSHDGAVNVLTFPKTATMYADSNKQQCVLISEN